ncbi:RxLR-like protein [Plasmopara halstedii]|uniref:RxLR-like protein n=1 Tax=Plasmopara halstedii TaxID=4781 RepID=A0A0P1B3J7_PLAHL|nr:RxLR-like protein [Plasmopara halstedii]CEG48805.1 RxLR-like protein [Plasmopara halstedii]|eukprot:XP_024585174.1 RxLR-like protein [Plasmopara halstedii]
MKSFQFIVTLFAIVSLDPVCVIGFQSEAHAHAEISNNAATNGLRRTQSVNSSTMEPLASGSSTSLTNKAEAPTPFMILLPDNLAMSYSGSGRDMFLDGSVGNDDSSESTLAGSDKIGDNVSGSLSTYISGLATGATAVTIWIALVIA